MSTENTALSQAKQKLLENLLKGQGKGKLNARPTISRRPADEPIPLSFAQQQVWAHALMTGDVPIYNEAVTVYRDGPLDVAVLEHCLVEILRRHEIWRTTFDMRSGDPIQVVHPAPNAFPLNLIDLRGMEKAERNLQARRLATEDAHKSFDLKNGPMLRVVPVRLDEEEYRLYITFHQLVIDAVSVYQVFLPELSTLYDAFSAGKPSPLPEPPLQYGDFAYWQQKTFTDTAVSAQLSFWREKLRGELPVLSWPNDRPRPAHDNHLGNVQRYTLRPEVVDALRAFCRKEGASSYMTLVASYVALLSRYTGQEDIVIGGVYAGRKLPDLDSVAGCFINPMALRVDVSGNPTFRELTRRVMSVVLDALANGDVPFNKILTGMHLRSDRPASPVFDLIVSQQPRVPVFAPGWNVITEEVSNGGSKADMMIVIDDRADNVAGPITYNTDLFDAASVSQMLQHWQTLLLGALAAPEIRISDIPLVTEDERENILVHWNNTGADYEDNACLHELFERQVAKTPEAVAAISGKTQLSFRELDSKANQLAHRLQRLGVASGDVVGVYGERSLEILVAMLGILKSGASYLPLDPHYPPDRLTFMIEDAGIQMMVSQANLADGIPQYAGKVIRLDSGWKQISQESTAPIENRGAQTDAAYVIYTSGSTGRPKGVLGTHRGAVNRFSWMWSTYPFQPGEICCQKTSLSFVDSVWEIFGPLLQGIPLVILSKNCVEDTNLLIDTLISTRVTRIVVVPSLLRAMLENLSQSRRTLADLKLCISSGEALPPDLVEQFFRCLPQTKLLNLYGSSEVAADATYYEVKNNETVTDVPIGRPIANTQIYLLDSRAQIVPVGTMGEIYVGGDGLALGYLNQPQLTAEKFIPNRFSSVEGLRLYKTGDLGRYRHDGALEYLGRSDHQVKLRGYRIELDEVQTALSAHELVGESTVIVREDEPGDKRLVAYVVVRPGSTLDASSLRGFLQKKLPGHMVPSAFVFLPKLPLTPNGKVDRKALPAIAAHGVETQAKPLSQRDPLEQALARIWAKILKVENVGPDSDFFELGGHSLAAVRMLSEVQKLIGKPIPLASLFQASTVQAFAEMLRNDGHAPLWSSLIPIQPQGSRNPLFLVHGAEGNLLVYRSLIQYLGADQPLYGLQSAGLDGEGSPHTTIEQMASQYVKEVTTVQPYGPYLLTGYCLGGVIAFEMAQQLRAMNKEVALVVMLDSYNPSAAWSSIALVEPLHFLQNLWFHAANFALIREGDRRRFLTEKADIELTRLKIMLQTSFHFLKRAFGGITPKSYPHLAIKKANHQAGNRYVPQPYNGRVVVVRTKGSFVGLADPTLGWNKTVSPGLEIHELPLYPKGMLVEPFSRLLAETLNQLLRAEETKPTDVRLPNSGMVLARNDT